MNQANLNNEMQLLDAALSFLARSQISGGESERMTEVKEFLLGRMRNLQATMQEQAKIPPAAPPAKMPPTN